MPEEFPDDKKRDWPWPSPFAAADGEWTVSQQEKYFAPPINKPKWEGAYTREYAQEILGAKCDECPLRAIGRFVPSAGPDTADVAFVGEAPGAQEAQKGIPFTGPSGKLLDKVNNYYKIDREKVFLSNACLCRPPDNTTPAKSAVAACRPRLLNELEGRATSTVVALGNTAAGSLLGVEGVTKLRIGPGRVSPYAYKSGGPLDGKELRVISTVHPAACLRQSDMFPSLVADVGKLVAPSVPFTEPEYRVFDGKLEALQVLRELEARAAELVVDIEVDIDKDNSFDHPNRYGLLCVGLSYEAGKAVVIGEGPCQDREVRDQLGQTLRASRIIAQNGKFDLAGLYPICGPLELYFDTMLASYCLDERPGIHGLKTMAVEYLGAPQYDEEIKRYVGKNDGYGVIPRKLLYKYNAYDASCTYSLYELFAKRLDVVGSNDEWPYEGLERRGLRDVHDFLVAASNQLMYMELNGIKVDLAYNDELTDSYLDTLGVVEEEIDLVLQKAWKDPAAHINPRSPQQVKAALLKLGARVDSTNEDTLKAIIERMQKQADGLNHPLVVFCNAMLVQRREQKLYGTYVKGIRKRMYNGRVYPTFMEHGTTTGRLACRNPNMQNVPRESVIRKQFVPAKVDWLFLEGDYAQAELRILTWLAEDEYFRGILNDDERDLFDELTPRLYPELPSKLDTPPALWGETRIRVKAFVYGLGYGRTEFSIASEYKIPVSEAIKVKDRFFETIPDIVEFQKRVKSQVKSGKDLVTPFGRHRRFHLITDENWKSVQNEALAFLPQSTSSDVCLRALTRIRPRLKGLGYVRNVVHDSILVEAHQDDIEEVKAIMNEEMVRSGQELVGDYVKFRADFKQGTHWGLK